MRLTTRLERTERAFSARLPRALAAEVRTWAEAERLPVDEALRDAEAIWRLTGGDPARMRGAAISILRREGFAPEVITAALADVQ